VTEPEACLACLRRARLLAQLAPYIERIATGASGSRSPELLRLDDEELAAKAAPKVAAQLLARAAALPERRLRADLVAAECWACCPHGPSYPAGLADAPDAPRALFGRGDPRRLALLEPAACVTVVGARRASSYGRQVALELGGELAAAGLAVVSGLAFGIDACAHRGAVERGLTVAVLGCGVDIAYPAAHRSLWRRIGRDGLVLSELPPGCGAWRWAFPARNRIMAALAGMTVVVEAAERSGSLITADLAADLGRDLGAVPGPIGSRLSAGPNGLLAGGACVVRGAQDVLDAMLGPGVATVERAGPALGPLQRDVLEAIERGADSADAVAASLDLNGAETALALAGLEALGYVDCTPLGTYTRTTLSPPRDMPPSTDI
jgi:DNA processing protein